MQANKGNLIRQCWKNAEVLNRALRSWKWQIPRRRLFLACLVKAGAGVQWLGGGFPLEIRDVVCRMDCAGLSVHSFCCALLIQSRAQGVIYCVLFRLLLQYHKSSSFVSLVASSGVSSPIALSHIALKSAGVSRCSADSLHRSFDYLSAERFPYPILKYGSYKPVHVMLLSSATGDNKYTAASPTATV